MGSAGPTQRRLRRNAEKPGWALSETDAEKSKRPSPKAGIAGPDRACCRTKGELPKSVQAKAGMQLPTREELRGGAEKPSQVLSVTDVEDTGPKRAKPASSITKPRCAALRIDGLKSGLKRSGANITNPNCPTLLVGKRGPMWHTSTAGSENTKPGRAAPEADVDTPVRTWLRADRNGPMEEKSNTNADKPKHAELRRNRVGPTLAVSHAGVRNPKRARPMADVVSASRTGSRNKGEGPNMEKSEVSGAGSARHELCKGMDRPRVATSTSESEETKPRRDKPAIGVKRPAHT